jgi:hypothetical protein
MNRPVQSVQSDFDTVKVFHPQFHFLKNLLIGRCERLQNLEQKKHPKVSEPEKKLHSKANTHLFYSLFRFVAFFHGHHNAFKVL